MLARRLFESSYESYESVQELAREFDVAGKMGDETIRGRSPNWTANETERLAHVLVDHSNATALTRLVSRASREQLDCGLRDQWSEEFLLLFSKPKCLSPRFLKFPVVQFKKLLTASTRANSNIRGIQRG
jgi:hypothetical protein